MRKFYGKVMSGPINCVCRAQLSFLLLIHSGVVSTGPLRNFCGKVVVGLLEGCVGVMLVAELMQV
jgi:hypothetical protein